MTLPATLLHPSALLLPCYGLLLCTTWLLLLRLLPPLLLGLFGPLPLGLLLWGLFGPLLLGTLLLRLFGSLLPRLASPLLSALLLSALLLLPLRRGRVCDRFNPYDMDVAKGAD